MQPLPEKTTGILAGVPEEKKFVIAVGSPEIEENPCPEKSCRGSAWGFRFRWFSTPEKRPIAVAAAACVAGGRRRP